MTTTQDRRTARHLEALVELEVEVRAAIAGAAAAVPPSPARRDDARLAALLAGMPELRDRYAEARARLRGKAASAAENLHRTRATETLRAWDLVERALAAAAAESAGPLLPPEPPSAPADPVTEKLAEAFRRLEDRVNGPKQSAVAAEHGCHPYISFNAQRFTEYLIAAWRILMATGRAETARFLEVGAGAGAKMLLAAGFFPQVEGIEYDPAYVAAGETLLAGLDETCRLMHGDALEFGDYAAYDVIYFYIPMKDDDGEREFEQRVGRMARDGAVIVAPHARVLPGVEGMAELAPYLFVKGLGPEAARELSRLACRVGPHVPPPRPPVKDALPGGHASQPPGLFQPLTEALARAGFRWL